MYSSMDRLKKALSGDDDDNSEKGIVTQLPRKARKEMRSEKRAEALEKDHKEAVEDMVLISDATTLSWSTRIKGFLICFILGAALSILGSCLLFMKNGLIIFGVLYTIGNVLSLSSTCFLMGPLNQIKKMFAKTRVLATILVFVMIILTLVCALAVKNPALTIVCCVIQFLALTWYSISYIPFARDAVIKCAGACLD